MDLGLRRDWAEFLKKLPSIFDVNDLGGSGLSMADTLRAFAREFSTRYGKFGPWGMPSSLPS